jgi:hypothetical protein
MTRQNSIDSFQRFSIESRRSSIELPCCEIINNFFHETDPIIKKRLLKDFRFKVLVDNNINLESVNNTLEQYFHNSTEFAIIDQEFLKEMLFNGFKPSVKLIQIFEEKQFSIPQFSNSYFLSGEKIVDNQTEIKLDDYRFEEMLKLNFLQTQNFKNSIELGLFGLERDKDFDTNYYQIMSLKIGDREIKLKLNGLAELLKSDNLNLAFIDGKSLQSNNTELLFYNDWREILRKINNEIALSKTFARKVIRLSQDISSNGGLLPITDFNNFSGEDSEISKTSCCCGLIKTLSGKFFKTAEKPSTSIVAIRSLSETRSSTIDNSSILFG